MKKLLQKIESLNCFVGEFQAEIKIRRRFEGYHGIASEGWETEYEFSSTEMKIDEGGEAFPSLSMKSYRYELFGDFIKRIEERIY